MKWRIPAKTFLLGEYAALADLGAIVLTTAPCFELTLTDTPGLDGIHPDSPAGRWWQRMGHADYGLHWYDPLNHCGGMGASSAQFVGAYWATSFLHESSSVGTSPDGVFTHPTLILEKAVESTTSDYCAESTELLSDFSRLIDAYWQSAWDGRGVRPSGYDVLAQSCVLQVDMPACVFIHRRDNRLDVSPWPFRDLAFIIAHTGYKLPTHHHLLDTSVPDGVEQLDVLVAKAHRAFVHADSVALVDAVNGYHQALVSMNRVSGNTQRLISDLIGQPELLAIKGCGAMGADVLIALTTLDGISAVSSRLADMNLKVMVADTFNVGS